MDYLLYVLDIFQPQFVLKTIINLDENNNINDKAQISLVDRYFLNLDLYTKL